MLSMTTQGALWSEKIRNILEASPSLVCLRTVILLTRCQHARVQNRTDKNPISTKPWSRLAERDRLFGLMAANIVIAIRLSGTISPWVSDRRTLHIGQSTSPTWEQWKTGMENTSPHRLSSTLSGNRIRLTLSTGVYNERQKRDAHAHYLPLPSDTVDGLNKHADLSFQCCLFCLFVRWLYPGAHSFLLALQRYANPIAGGVRDE